MDYLKDYPWNMESMDRQFNATVGWGRPSQTWSTIDGWNETPRSDWIGSSAPYFHQPSPTIPKMDFEIGVWNPSTTCSSSGYSTDQSSNFDDSPIKSSSPTPLSSTFPSPGSIPNTMIRHFPEPATIDNGFGPSESINKCVVSSFEF